MGADLGGASGASTGMAIQSLIRIFVGVGILSLSYQVKTAGIIAYSSLLVILAYIALWCILRLSEACDMIMKAEARRNMLRRKYAEKRRAMGASPTVDELNQIELFDSMGQYSDADIEEVDRKSVPLPTLTEVGIIAYGWWGGFITDASIIITQIGACTAYVIFISGTMADVTGLDRKIWIGILWVPLILLSIIRDMAKLAIFSSIANIVYIYTLAVIFYQGYTQRCCIEFKDAVMFEYKYLPIVFGSLSFALEGIALVLPIRNRMKNPESFNFAMSLALLVIAFLYFSVANVGYLFYGDATDAPLIKNLTPGALTQTVQISLSITIFITFAMAVYPVSFFNDTMLDERYYRLNFSKLRVEWEAQQGEIALQQQQQREAAGGASDDAPIDLEPPKITNEDLVPQDIRVTRYLIQNLHRIAFITLTAVIALVLPSFKLVVALFGAFSNALLAYILPALFWVRICTPQLFDGEIWYPYDRDGRPTKNYEGSLQQAVDINFLSTTNGDDDDDDAAGTKAKTNTKVTENAPLVLNTEIDSDKYGGNRAQKTPLVSTFGKISYLLFPYTVAILGSLASIIAVFLAIQDIITELF